MKPTYSVDRKAPRMRKGKFSKMVVTKDLWKKFIKENQDYKDLTWKDFYQLWLDIAYTIRHEAIENPLGVKLDKFTGELKLQYLPYKFEPNDYHTSQEIEEKVNHLNIVSKGKTAKIKWERRWAVKFNRILQFYAFDETRDMNKLAKEYIDKNPTALRISRITLGGKSTWIEKKKQ